MSWRSTLRTFIIGTERGPLPESDLEALGLPPSSDPAQTALEGLVAANLLRKAGFVPTEFPISQFPISATDGRRICDEAAVKDLNTMLSGRYAEALPEFLTLLAQKKLQLPPELLPALLEKAVRDNAVSENLRLALGPRGTWLARQHPDWNALLQSDEADWFTAAFAERKRLLTTTRARNPLLALAWLEKTWPEEKADHKLQFIEILQNRLSPADEDLLEKASADKSRELRRAALQLLMLLPESKGFSEANHFFTERLAGALLQKNRAETDAFLKKSMPDLSEEALQPWLTILSKDALGDWRNELLCLFIRLLPPAGLPVPTGHASQTLPELFNEVKFAAAFLEAIVRHGDDSRVEAVLRHFSGDFRHAIWQSKEMTVFLTRFAPAAMDFLCRNNFLIGYDNQVILRSLENYRLPWPKRLLDDLLEQYRHPAYGNGDIPGWHYASALHNAAYHCRPQDAIDSALVRDYLQHPPKARPREFEEFLGIIRFRLNMQGHLQ